MHIIMSYMIYFSWKRGISHGRGYEIFYIHMWLGRIIPLIIANRRYFWDSDKVYMIEYMNVD